jgi:hypothetical protein
VSLLTYLLIPVEIQEHSHPFAPSAASTCPFFFCRPWLGGAKLRPCCLPPHQPFQPSGQEHNDRHVRGHSETTCPPLPPEDGRFDPTSPTSIDSS